MGYLIRVKARHIEEPRVAPRPAEIRKLDSIMTIGVVEPYSLPVVMIEVWLEMLMKLIILIVETDQDSI